MPNNESILFEALNSKRKAKLVVVNNGFEISIDIAITNLMPAPGQCIFSAETSGAPKITKVQQ